MRCARSRQGIPISSAAQCALLPGFAVAEPTATARAAPAPALAVVGLACRFPDADDGPELLDVVLTGRRSFRRIPPARLDIADYFQPDRATSDATYSTRAALIEGWRFDYAAFGVRPASYAAADPALWLALETTARALAGAGLTAGSGLNRDRTGVIIGNTLAGDTSRANALRVRWPYVRRVLSRCTGNGGPGSAGRQGATASRAAVPGPVPDHQPGHQGRQHPRQHRAAICSYFGFRGGSHAVDSTCSSSLQAVSSACSALAAGDLDAAIAGGVDVSLDPFELIGLAKAGALATDEVRIYDQHPTGYLPAEGCGMVVLMRTHDARAAGLPVYAEIVGWGTSTGGSNGEARTGVSSQLLAMQRAYERAGRRPRRGSVLRRERGWHQGRGRGRADRARGAARECPRTSRTRLGQGEHRPCEGRCGFGRADQDRAVAEHRRAAARDRRGGTPELITERRRQAHAAAGSRASGRTGSGSPRVSTLSSRRQQRAPGAARREPQPRPRADRWLRSRSRPARSLDATTRHRACSD